MLPPRDANVMNSHLGHFHSRHTLDTLVCIDGYTIHSLDTLVCIDTPHEQQTDCLPNSPPRRIHSHIATLDTKCQLYSLTDSFLNPKP